MHYRAYIDFISNRKRASSLFLYLYSIFIYLSISISPYLSLALSISLSFPVQRSWKREYRSSLPSWLSPTAARSRYAWLLCKARRFTPGAHVLRASRLSRASTATNTRKRTALRRQRFIYAHTDSPRFVYTDVSMSVCVCVCVCWTMNETCGVETARTARRVRNRFIYRVALSSAYVSRTVRVSLSLYSIVCRYDTGRVVLGICVCVCVYFIYICIYIRRYWESATISEQCVSQIGIRAQVIACSTATRESTRSVVWHRLILEGCLGRSYLGRGDENKLIELSKWR